MIYRYPATRADGVRECPAVIVRVWSETLVNLRLLEDGPLVPEWCTSVELEAENAVGTPGRWSWPTKV